MKSNGWRKGLRLGLLCKSLTRAHGLTIQRRWLSDTAKGVNPVVVPGSEKHHDKASFQEYARRVDLAPTTTVYVGTLYEYTVAESLRRLGFDLTRTGRASDKGIDLLGQWAIPALPEPLKVFIQCKALKRSLDPKNVRELEGAFIGLPAEWRQEKVIGLLATMNKATKGVMEAMGRSRWPMGFMKVTGDGTVEQFVWNQSAIDQGFQGLGVTLRYQGRSEEQQEEGSPVRRDITLTWMGRPLMSTGKTA